MATLAAPVSGTSPATAPALPRYAVLDVIAVVVLMATAFSAFAGTFAGWRWISVSAAGAAIGIVWALLLIRWRQGMDVVMVSLVAPYFLTAGSIALGSRGFFGLPDPETLNRVLVGSVQGWRLIAETAPPVAARGDLLLVPYLLALTTAGTATAMALRSRRALPPVLSLLMLLITVTLLGVQSPSHVLLRGLVFGVVALAWLGHRGLRNETGRWSASELRSVAPARVLSGLLALGLVAAIGAPLVNATPESKPPLTFREIRAAYDSATDRTPLAAVRDLRSPEQLADTLLFTVDDVKPGTMVRLAVLDEYDGEQWVANPDADPADEGDRFLRVSPTMSNPAQGDPARATVRVRNDLGMVWVPVIGAVQSFDLFDEVGTSPRAPELRYNRSTDSALIPGGLRAGEAYTMATILGPTSLSPRMKASSSVDPMLQEAGAFLDEPARAWSAGAKTPMQGVFAIAEQLRKRGRYSDGLTSWEQKYAPGQSPERLGEGFVAAPHQVGNDEQYAAAMALMANRIGVPARIVVGAEVRPSGKIRGRQLEAWVEVRVADGSWRILPRADFTSSRPPAETDQPLTPPQLPGGPGGTGTGKPGKGSGKGSGKNSGKKSGDTDSGRSQDESPDQTSESSKSTTGSSNSAPTWPVVLLLLTLMGLIPLTKLLRRRRRAELAGPAGFAAGWTEVIDTAQDLGLAVPRSVRSTQATALDLPPTLARQADIGAFAAEPSGSVDRDDYWQEIDGARAALRQRSPWWRRWSAPLNPRSLLRRW